MEEVYNGEEKSKKECVNLKVSVFVGESKRETHVKWLVRLHIHMVATSRLRVQIANGFIIALNSLLTGGALR